MPEKPLIDTVLNARSCSRLRTNESMFVSHWLTA